MINNKDIKEHNELQFEVRKDLPNLVECIKRIKNGEKELLDLMFYTKRIVENYFVDGKKRNYIVDEIHFWDRETDVFLRNIKKKYCKQMSSSETSKWKSHNISMKVDISKFEEEEIDSLFFEFFEKFVNKINLDKFVKDTESKTLNAVRKYMRIDFENNFLKQEHNERMGIERKTVDGKVYYVTTKPHEVLFDDINCGYNDEGEKLDFLDLVAHNDVHIPKTLDDIVKDEENTKVFIEENLEEVLTEKQLQKWNKLIKHVRENGVEKILDPYTGKIKKSEVSRILFPHRKTTSTVREIDSFIESVNRRLEKRLREEGLKFVSREEEIKRENRVRDRLNSDVIVYKGGYTEEDVERHFNQHIESILRGFVEGRFTWDKGSNNNMLPSTDLMEEIPMNVYYKWLRSGINTRKEIIREYHNKDKFNIKVSEREVLRTEKVYEEKPNNFITPEELKQIRENK